MKAKVGPESTESRAWKTLFLVTFVNSAHASLSIVGLPAHATALGLSSSTLSTLLAAAPVCAGIAAFSMGAISDFVNRRSLLQFGLALLGASLLLHLFAQNTHVLLGLRCLAGFASGILFGLPSTLLSDSFHVKRQQSLTGKTLCGYAIGQTVGIPGGIALLEVVDFLTLCSGIGALAFASLFLSTRFLPNPKPLRKRSEHPLSTHFKQIGGVLKSHRFRRLTLVSMSGLAALSLFYVSFALWLFETAGLRPVEIAPMYFCGGLLQIFVLGVLNTKFEKLPPHLTVAISFACNSLVFAFAAPAFQNIPTAATLFALTLGTVSIRIPPMQFLTHHCGPANNKGLRMSVVQSGNQLGRAIGSTAAPLLLQKLDIQQIAFVSGGITLACAALLFTFPRTTIEVTLDPGSDNHPNRLRNSTESKKEGGLWHAGCSLKMSRKQLTPCAKAKRR